MKKILILPFIVLCLTASVSYAQKIATVDLEGAMAKSEAGKKALSELRADAEKATERAKKIQAERDSLAKDLEAQRSLLSQDKIQKQLSEIQKKNVELERLQNDTAQELQRKEMQHVGAIVQEMRKVIETYAKEKKIDIVLEGRAGAIYANPALDITDEIVKRFDNQWKKRK